jgi:hypothetical protein
MTTASLTISLTGSGTSAADVWLRLEQVKLRKTANNATIPIIADMIARARSGLSARTTQIDACEYASVSSDGRIVMTIGAYIWPSSMDLAFDLSPSGVEAGPLMVVQVPRDVDLAVSGETALTLPWLLADGATATWQFGCYDDHSNMILPPTVTVSGSTVHIEYPCYGVLRIKGLALGYRVDLTAAFTKDGDPNAATAEAQTIPDPDPYGFQTVPIPFIGADPVTANPTEHAWQSITDIKCSLLASWTDTAQQPQSTLIEIIIPECVKALMELCPSEVPVVFGLFKPEHQGDILEILFNGCTGEYIGRRYVEPKDDRHA